MRKYIQKIATGPELSKDLSREEARDAMDEILSGTADPVQAAIFLIALRMKRETMEENFGVLDSLLSHSVRVKADVELVVDISDPFDGFNRGLPAAPFLPCVLAACGISSISNGAESIGPKFGITHRKVLRSAGIPVDMTPATAADQLANPSIGWAYVDQRKTCPALHALADLRSRIVKRPCLTTLEVLLGPVSGYKETCLVTGYVHKPYPPVYTALSRESNYTSALIVRGVEGGVIPSLSQKSKLFCYHGSSNDEEVKLDPKQFGIFSDIRSVPLSLQTDAPKKEDNIITSFDTNELSKLAAKDGLDALTGVGGPMRDSLIYGATICLSHIENCSDQLSILNRVKAAIDSGKAYEHFKSAANALLI